MFVAVAAELSSMVEDPDTRCDAAGARDIGFPEPDSRSARYDFLVPDETVLAGLPSGQAIRYDN